MISETGREEPTQRVWSGATKDYTGVYLMQDGDAFKVGQSGGIRSRLSHVRKKYPGTRIHSYVRTPLGDLDICERMLLNFCWGAGFEICPRGDWFYLKAHEVVMVQTAMMVLSAQIHSSRLVW